jgi:hypothetical protein
MSLNDEKSRKHHNDELLARFYRGESLAVVSPQSTWFPPRPIIKKDENALEVIFDINKKPKLNLVNEDGEK